MRILVVDGANVVGSRADGWWRDRAGAARRLHGELLAAALAYDEVVLVLEGAARAGVPVGREGEVVTRHAAGSGDDEIVQAVREHGWRGDEVVVVTADRELRARVLASGAEATGPGSLLAQL